MLYKLFEERYSTNQKVYRGTAQGGILLAILTGVFGVPHTPAFPKLVADGVGPAEEISAYYAVIRQAVRDSRPDVIVLLADDHLNTFFLDNFPAFALGVDTATWGPNDGTEGLQPRPVEVRHDLAVHLLENLTSEGFDIAQCHRFAIDHAMVVPLHFLTPALDVPVVPFWINELVPPIPTARRSYELGKALRRCVESFPAEARVALVASGSFSLEVGGVHIAPGQNYGVPDPGWTDTVVTHLSEGRAEDLIRLATPERLHRAGNVGGELLSWLTVWGAVDGAPPKVIKVQPQFGHAYADWGITA